MTKKTQITMRAAEATDALALAKLIDIAGEGIPNWLWSKSSDAANSPLEIGSERARRTSGGFSYTNATVALQDDQIAGMLLGYPIIEAPDDDIKELPTPIAPFVELEKQSVGTWYVNALAVFAGQRGAGTGSLLMSKAEELAKVAGYNRTSIQVYSQNVGAVKLYRKLGYVETSRSKVLNHPCQPYYDQDVLLLIKQLAD